MKASMGMRMAFKAALALLISAQLSGCAMMGKGKGSETPGAPELEEKDRAMIEASRESLARACQEDAKAWEARGGKQVRLVFGKERSFGFRARPNEQIPGLLSLRARIELPYQATEAVVSKGKARVCEFAPGPKGWQMVGSIEIDPSELSK